MYKLKNKDRTYKSLSEEDSNNIANNKYNKVSINRTGLESFIFRYDNITMLDLRSNKLEKFSIPEIMPNLKTIFLTLNKLTEFNSFAKVPNLEKLDLSFNNISSINELNKNNKLKSLNLKSNRNNIRLRKFYYLEVLDISENKIIEVDLHNFPNLRYLTASNNNITDIKQPDDHKYLREIYLQNNNLGNFTLSCSLPNLIKLDLSKNNMTNFICNRLERLRIFIAEDNKLKILPTVCIKNVARIMVKDNLFESVNLNNFKDLRYLDLRNNKLKVWSDIKNSKLEVLLLENNSLSQFSNYNEYKKLYILDLANNDLRKLDINRYYPNLRVLKLNGNNIKSFTGYKNRLQVITYDTKNISIDIKLEDVEYYNDYDIIEDIYSTYVH